MVDLDAVSNLLVSVFKGLQDNDKVHVLYVCAVSCMRLQVKYRNSTISQVMVQYSGKAMSFEEAKGAEDILMVSCRCCESVSTLYFQRQERPQMRAYSSVSHLACRNAPCPGADTVRSEHDKSMQWTCVCLVSSYYLRTCVVRPLLLDCSTTGERHFLSMPI